MAKFINFSLCMSRTLEYKEVRKAIGFMTGAFVLDLDTWLFEQKSHCFEKEKWNKVVTTLDLDEEKADQFLEASLKSGLYTLIDGSIYSPRVNEQIEGLFNRTKGFRNKDKETSENIVTTTRREGDVVVTTALQDRIGQDRTGQDLININSQVEKLEFHEPDELLKIPEPETEDEREAENQLLKPTGAEPWEKTNQFMLAGRRPFALFPQVFITRRELAAVVKAYKNAGVAHRIGEACITINARLDSWRIEGRDPQKATISAWFLGFVLTELIESETHATRLENAQKPRVPIPENQRYPRKSGSSFVNNLVGNTAKTRGIQ